MNIQSAFSVPGIPLTATQARVKPLDWGSDTLLLFILRDTPVSVMWVLLCFRPANNQRNRRYTRTRGEKDGKQNRKVLWQFSVRGAVMREM